jgi:hypothetical protein
LDATPLDALPTIPHVSEYRDSHTEC